MRKDLSLLLAAAIFLCSCGNKAPDATTPAETIPTDVKSGADVTQTQESEEKTLLLSYDGVEFYLEDADSITPYGKNQSVATYTGKAKGFVSKGTYYDNFLNPELFGYTEKGHLDFLGEAMANEQEWITDFSSDSYNIKTNCSFNIPEDNSIADDFIPFFYNEIIISGDIILSGEFYYFTEEQPYVSAGDVKFKPDGSYIGLPHTDPTFWAYFSNEYPSRYTFDKVVYCDSPLLDLGNIHKDSELYEMVSDIIGDGSSSVNVSAEINLAEIVMGYSDTMWLQTAVAKSITVKE